MYESSKLSLVKALTEGIQEVVFIMRVEEEQRFVYEFVNNAANSIIGKYAVGKSFREALPEEIAEILENHFAEAYTTKKIIKFEIRVPHFSPENGYAETTLTPILNSNNECTHIVAIAKNITEEKSVKIEFEENLQLLEETKSEYRSLFDYNGDAIFSLDLEGVIQDGNPMIQAVSGRTVKELKGENFTELLDYKYREKISDAFSLAFTGDLKSHRIRLLQQTGEKISCLIHFAPIKNREEILGIFAIVKDMGEIDKLLGQYIQSEKNFRIIAENVQDVVILMNHDKEYLYVSPSSKKVFGFDNTKIDKKAPFFNIHPDYVSLLEQKFQHSVSEGSSFTIELKGMHGERGWIWTEINGNPVYDAFHNFRHMVLIARDISLQKENESQLEYFAYHDSLTSLPNRRFFRNQLSEALAKIKAGLEEFAVVMLDIDNFKYINDTFGHETGDEVIHEFAKRLKYSLDDSDFVARLGGDEFIILLPNIKEIPLIIEKVKRIQKAIKEPWLIEGSLISITSSIGVVHIKEATFTASSLLKMVDDAMYTAKKAGKNMYYINESTSY